MCHPQRCACQLSFAQFWSQKSLVKYFFPVSDASPQVSRSSAEAKDKKLPKRTEDSRLSVKRKVAGKSPQVSRTLAGAKDKKLPKRTEDSRLKRKVAGKSVGQKVLSPSASPVKKKASPAEQQLGMFTEMCSLLMTVLQLLGSKPKE